MEIKSYRDLDVWKSGIRIVTEIYQLTKKFPPDERFGLISQMQRASVSIPTNIAEGFARRYTKEFKKFSLISLGSCSELETLLLIAQKQDFVKHEEVENLERLLDSESRMLMSLVKKLDV